MYNGRESAEEPPPPPHELAMLAHVLERLVARNDRIEAEEPDWAAEAGLRRRGLAAFRSARAPSIAVGKYLERIQRYTGMDPSCFVVAFVYIDRTAHRHPASLVMSFNVHRLILTSLLIASKVLDDTHHNNAFFARVGGVSNAELNKLELELLFLLDFEVAVSSRVFESYCLHMEKEMLWSGPKQIPIIKSLSAIDAELDRRANISRRHSSSPPRHSITY
ncbi:cyclin-U1-1 [Typha latifolia]|uniref:cyclin-U1-1 n=1 Tax=Typha latifolia TaxID=4733 RepID=UPI003C2B3DA1